MALTPPQAPPTWDHSADDITKFTKDSIETYRNVLDKVGALEPKDATFESVSLHLTNIFQTNLSQSLPRYLCVSMMQNSP
jgi:metallopeptidase MepB